jgi:hypothetical protein
VLRTALLFVRSAVRLVYAELPGPVAVGSPKQAHCELGDRVPPQMPMTLSGRGIGAPDSRARTASPTSRSTAGPLRLELAFVWPHRHQVSNGVSSMVVHVAGGEGSSTRHDDDGRPAPTGGSPVSERRWVRHDDRSEHPGLHLTRSCSGDRDDPTGRVLPRHSWR